MIVLQILILLLAAPITWTEHRLEMFLVQHRIVQSLDANVSCLV